LISELIRLGHSLAKLIKLNFGDWDVLLIRLEAERQLYNFGDVWILWFVRSDVAWLSLVFILLKINEIYDAVACNGSFGFGLVSLDWFLAFM
jgi:hypothetical protein